jgi:DNA primase
MIRRTVERHDLGTVEGRSAAVAAALPYLQQLADPVRRSEYAGLLADLAGVSESSVLQSLERRLGGQPSEVAKTIKRTTAQERVEREMLKLLAGDADTFRETVQTLTEEHFRTPASRRLFVALRDADGDVGAIVGGPDPQLAGRIASLVVEPLEGDRTPEYTEGVLARLQEFLLKSRSDRIRMELQKLNPTVDPAWEERFRDLAEVDGELRRIRQRLHGEV